MLIRTGDTVEVIAGAYKGKQSRVIQVNRADGKAIIEGVAKVFKLPCVPGADPNTADGCKWTPGVRDVPRGTIEVQPLEGYGKYPVLTAKRDASGAWGLASVEVVDLAKFEPPRDPNIE